MLKKISTKIIFTQWLFLGIAVGGSVLLYRIFLPTYYEHYKNKQIIEAYEDISELDLSNLIEENYSMFSDYEKESLIFTIADEEMQPVYTTRAQEESAIYKDIAMRKHSFSVEPKIIQRESKLTEPIKLLGIIQQDGRDFYVCIRDRVSNIYATFRITEKFLGTMFIITFLVGSFLMFFLSRRIVKPIEQIATIADQVAQKDFHERASENGDYAEINQMGKSINSISKQLQKSCDQIEKSQKRLLTQNIREERMEKARKEFVANISHELKTPLTVISSQLEMLQYTKSETDQEYYYTSIQEEVSKMSDMVGELLDISVMEHSMENMVKKPFDMKEVMEYMTMKYQGLFKKKKNILETRFDEACIVFGDRDYIEQAINNYLMNAFQHTDIGGEIRISMKKQKESVWIGVYNEGPLIDESDIAHIWQSFYMKEVGEKQDSEHYSNVGLGLYIVQSVIEMHEGKCGVENLEDGVEFWFTLPLQKRADLKLESPS